MLYNILILLVPTLTMLKISLNDDLEALWSKHKETYDLTFSVSEDEIRKSIFEANHMHIKKHNLHDSPYKLGLNQFSHLNNFEFASQYLRSVSINQKSQNQRVTEQESYKDVSDVDWRKKHAVTDVQNQGKCGSCWAFSATGSLEGQLYLKKNKSTKLSEQDLIDCSKSYGNEGCKGGLPDIAFQYVMKYGINNITYYPYMAKDTKCVHVDKLSTLNISNFELIEGGDEITLQMWIQKIGPISVSMDASGIDFQHYKSGVYQSDSCSGKFLNHDILAVGMGSKPSKHYIVKNSWGKSWGMNGYFLIDRGHNNMCGIASYITYPIL